MSVSPRSVLVAAGALVRGGRLLLTRRPLRGAHPGLWELPGGKVEPDETPEAALVREWREELGVSIAGLTPLIFTTERRPDAHVTLLFFKIACLGGEPRPLHADGLRESGADEARLLAMPPADVPVVDRLLADGGGRFLDTVSADDRACNEALLEEPYIEGSESLDGAGVKFVKRIAGRVVEGLLVPTPEGVRAYENVCPHVPIPLDRIESGFLSHGRLVCKNHGALFTPESGLCVAGPCHGETLRPIRLVALEGGWAVSS